MSSEAAKKAWATRRANGYQPKAKPQRPAARDLFLTPVERRVHAALDVELQPLSHFVTRCQAKTSDCTKALRKLEAHGLAEHEVVGSAVQYRRARKGGARD